MSAPQLHSERLSDGFRPSHVGWEKRHYTTDDSDAVYIPAEPSESGPDGKPLCFELTLVDWNGDVCPIPSDILGILVSAPTLHAKASAFLSVARETRVLLNAARRESRDKDSAITEAVSLLRECGHRGAFDAKADNSLTRFIRKHGGWIR